MEARAIWKAELVLAEERLPVKMYAAAQDRGIHFHLLHAKDGARVNQRMAHAESGETVPSAEMRRGIEIGPGRFVILEEDELEALAPRPSRGITVERFLPAGVIDHVWYQRPYYLGPDGDAGRYWALVEAIEASGLEALAFWTMRKREHVGALRLHQERLVLVSLHHAEEVLPAAKLEAPAGRALDEREQALAGKLIEAMSGPFEHAAFADEYRQRVLELVQAKRKGKPIRLERYRARPASDDSLLKSLQASLRKAG